MQDALEKSKTYLSGICQEVEFGGTKQKILNAIFGTLVDAYLDRFIVAASHDLKLKLFEQQPPLNPYLFTLTGLATQKQVKIKPIDFKATLADHALFEKLCLRIDRDIEYGFKAYA